jgi:hypothetical protein
MARNGKIVKKPMKIDEEATSCSECGFKIDARAEMCPNCRAMRPVIPQNLSESNRTNKDPVAEGLLRICAIINGTWDDILASIQSISFMREVALYIDCTILAIWKRKKKQR